eukprot:sb/3466441/
MASAVLNVSVSDGSYILLTSSMISDLLGVDETLYDNQVSLNVTWIVFATSLVFIMQAGFTMIEVGSVRIKNTKSILIKNLLDCCFGSVVFFAYGWALAFGESNAFIVSLPNSLPFLFRWQWFHVIERYGKHHGGGSTYLCTVDFSVHLLCYCFNHRLRCVSRELPIYGVVCHVVPIYRAVAERTQLFAYLVYTFFLTTFIYPPVAHWLWTEEGWASQVLFLLAEKPHPQELKRGVSAVHMVGGSCALIGAWLVGPRIGRFDKSRKIAKQNTVFQVLGTLLLWFGWYGFNCGSTQSIIGTHAQSASKIGVATTASAAASGKILFYSIVLGYWLVSGSASS